MRHHHVQQDGIGQLGADRFQGLQAVVRLDDLIAFQFKVHADEADHAWFIIDNEDTLHIAWGSAWRFISHTVLNLQLAVPRPA
jgi:hypothetical protein